ncbi:hypothetical protein DY000_02038624 [Brassica cretica]|uniref:Uncharacterized protein n=1 Tax=Brassica cretica TaxID=69181 RepID=A0ABQ7BD06_BRACR|nr:hypothetical protein DY000_02038624 [Brassica cretica]
MAPKKNDTEVNMDQLQQQMSRVVVTEMGPTMGRVDSMEQRLQTMREQLNSIFARWEQKAKAKEEEQRRLMEKARGKSHASDETRSEGKIGQHKHLEDGEQSLLVDQTPIDSRGNESGEDMGWLRRTVDGNCPRKPDSTEMPLLLARGFTNNEDTRGRKQHWFRICRPVASFSWPNLPALAAATDNDEIASLPSHHRPSPSLTCPVKPLAAKRPLVLPFPFTATPQDQAPTNLFNL